MVGVLLKRMEKFALVFFIAFVIVLAALVSAAVVYEKSFTESAFESRGSIFIQGDEDLLEANGVVSGSGVESDPYIIEGWNIQTPWTHGISISHTNAHLVIRNVTIAPVPYAHSERVGAGVILTSVSNVTIETTEVFGFLVGVLVNGSADSRCEAIKISELRLAGNSEETVVRNTTGLEILRIVTQPYYYDSGIQLDNCTDFSVRSCLIQGYGSPYSSSSRFGMMISSSSRGTVDGNEVCSPEEYAKGIWIRNSANVDVSNNSLSYIDEMSIWVEHSSNITITKNAIQGWNNRGIYVEYSLDFLISENRFSKTLGQWHSSASLATAYSMNGTIRNNSLVECGGISAYECSDILISDNLVDRAGSAGSGEPLTGIYVRGTDIVASRNVVTGGQTTGIFAAGDNITVADSEITHNCRSAAYGSYETAGVVASGTNMSIVGNLIRNNSVSGTYIEVPGVRLQYLDNSTFSENNVSDIMYVYYCESVDIVSNRFYGNWGFPFLTTISNSNVSFWGNSFLDTINLVHQITTSVFRWDAGYPTGGNYWSEYAGVDLKSGPNQNQPGSDGIGDSPYQVTTGEYDNYPLMSPASSSDLSAPMTFASLSASIGTFGWFTSPVDITLRATDIRGEVESISYSLDGAASDTYTSVVTVTGDGRHSIEFHSVDAQGNSEPNKTIDIWIDSTPPFPVQGIKTEYRFRGVGSGYIFLEFGDNTSGIAYIAGAYDVTSYAYRTVCPFISVSLYDGTKVFRATAFDAAGYGCVLDITIKSTPHPNTDLLSLSGPYGPWYSTAAILDGALLIAALLALASTRDWPPPSQSKRDEGQRHYDEDVIDGYGKFQKRF
jgi:parallel beta-helix repeat protein